MYFHGEDPSFPAATQTKIPLDAAILTALAMGIVFDVHI
jgi:hypothetical protein